MRILKVELQNINSIKSNHPVTIDFETNSFVESGLFVITGSTGAGKTTILDAITIALYHQVPRFGKSHIKSNLEDVISHGAAEGLCRVVFTSGLNRYEAQWNMRLRKKNGERLTNPVEVVRLKNLSTEEIISEKKNEMKQKIVDITQLSYNQFLRSMMLAQGEFAAFISANAKEKGNLLEQITGDDIYKRIGDQLNIRISKEEKLLKDIASKINTEDLLSEPQIEELNNELKSISAGIEEQHQKKKFNTEQLDWYTQNESIAKDRASLQIQAEALKNEIEIHTDQLNLLKKIENAEHFSEEISLQHNTIEALKQKKNRLTEIETQFVTLQPQLEKATIQKNEAQEDRLKTEANHELWAAKLTHVRKIDTIIHEINEREAQARKELKIQQDKQKEIKDEYKVRSLQSESFTKEQNNIRKWIQNNRSIETYKVRIDEWIKNFEQYTQVKKQSVVIENEIKEKHLAKQKQSELAEAVIQKMKSLNDQLQTSEEAFKKHQSKDYLEIIDKDEQKSKQFSIQLQNLQLAYRTSRDFQNRKREEKELLEMGKESDRACKVLSQTLEKTDKLIGVYEQSIVDLEQMIAQEQLILNLEQEREKLIEGKPCALCGSTSHPFVNSYQAPKLETRNIELQKRKEEEKAVRNERQDIVAKLKVEQSKVERGSEALTKNRDQIQQLIKEFHDLDVEIGITETDQIEEHGKAMRKQSETIEEQILTIKRDQKLKETLQVEINKIKVDLDPLKVQQNTTTATLEALSKEITVKLEQQKTIKAELQQVKTNIQSSLISANNQLEFTEDTDQLISSIQASIKHFDEQMNREKQVIQQIELLESAQIQDQKRIQELQEEIDIKQGAIQEIVKQIEDHQTKRQQLLPKTTTAQQKEEEITKQLTGARKAFEIASEAYSKIDKELEKNSELQKENRSQMNQLVADIEDQQKALTKKVEQSTFTSIDEVKSILDQSAKKSELTAINDRIRSRTIEIRTLDADIKKRNQILSLKKKPELDVEQIKIEIEHQNQHHEQYLQRQGEISQAMKTHRSIVERNETVIKKIDTQKQELNRWKTLLNLLGGSKDAFNTYVQRLTLKNLIDIANIHLLKLNPRYALKLDEQYNKGEELTFKLVDYYQANESRNVETASGGEKFIMSLALALGLSDMSSQNVQIESLFIDEGFGTLDSELLETVISALESLKSQGKTIGVISHIDALKERIPTQIHLMKNGNGTSEVEIFA